jgi:hypothetical protein
MNRKFNKLNPFDENQEKEQRQHIQDVLNYFLSEGVVVETKKGYYRLKTNKEIQREIAEICKN